MRMNLDHWFAAGNKLGTRMNLDHWFTSENNLSISLWNFYGRINIVYDGEDVCFPITIYTENREQLEFDFYALDDAVSFVEGINKMFTKDEVMEYHKENFFWKEVKAYEKIKNEGYPFDNELSISLWNFYARIDIVYNGETITYPVGIYADGKEVLNFDFSALNQAVHFVEGIEKMLTKEEVYTYYQKEFKDKEVKRKTLR